MVDGIRWSSITVFFFVLCCLFLLLYKSVDACVIARWLKTVLAHERNRTQVEERACRPWEAIGGKGTSPRCLLGSLVAAGSHGTHLYY